MNTGSLQSASQSVLAMFARWPEPGRTKTRLAAETSPVWAAEVARAFLLDLLDRLAAVAARRVVAFTPPGKHSAFEAVVADRFDLVPQAEGDLGRRIQAFFAGEFQHGAHRVVLLGSDSPTVPLEHIQEAFQLLGEADIVLGPATDGGYYLIGCRERVPPVFEGIAWSRPTVLAETVAGLAARDLRLGLLPPWYDVDTLADWRMLVGHLVAMRRAGQDPGLPRVEACIQTMPQ